VDPEGVRLLILLYAYNKPCLCINIHHYAPPRTVLQQPASLGAAPRIVLRQAAAVLVKVQHQVLNRAQK